MTGTGSLKEFSFDFDTSQAMNSATGVLPIIGPFPSTLYKQVERLRFKGSMLHDPHAVDFIKEFSSVSVLTLESARITGLFLVDIIKAQKPPRYEKITLKDCDSVSPDAVQWIRSRGIQLEVKKTDMHLRGGRKLREGD